MTDLISGLNAEQKQAATSTNKRLQIIAGAGTGKTHTLIARIAFMVKHGVRPENILLITFTNKAAAEMKRRADEDTGGQCKNVTATTFHSFCAEQLRIYGTMNDQYKDFEILDESKSYLLMDFVRQKYKDALKPLKDKVPKNKRLGSKDMVSMLSMSINTDRTVNDIVEERGYDEKALPYIVACIDLYIQEKRKGKILDFDDLLTEFLKVLNIDPKFRQMLQMRYRYILVDEHQDSNNLQNRILQLLTSDHSFLTVVGDEFQSIYAFRGANVEHFMNFEQEYMNDTKNAPQTVHLQRNYRSTQEILDLSNNTTRNADFGDPKHLHNDQNGVRPRLYVVSDQRREAEEALNLILKYQQDSPPNEIAVLVRGSNDSAFLEEQLTHLGIKFDKRGGIKFFDAQCVQDILSFQGLCLNDQDTLHWFRIFQLLREVASKRAQDLTNEIHKKDFLMNSQFANKETKTAKLIHGQLVELNDTFNKIKAERDISKQLDIIVSYLKSIYDKQIEYQREQDNNEQLQRYQNKYKDLEEKEAILKNMISRYKTLQEWLDAVSLNKTIDEEDEGKLLVISTIHSAKGLEWNHVILLKMVEGSLPSSYTLKKEYNDREGFKKEMDEDRRAFYVATTRPRYTLDIFSPRFCAGSLDRTTTSRFVNESINFVDEYHL